MERHMEYKTRKILSCCKSFIILWLYSISSNVLAQNGRGEKIFESLNNQFSAKSAAKDQQFGEFFLLVIAGVVLIFVAWLAYQFLLHRKKSASPDTAWGLYHKLCRVHNLSMKEKYVVRKVYRLMGLEDPLPLFVEPNYFKQVLADETMQQYHLTAQSLLDKLFGSGQALSQQTIRAAELPTETSQEANRNDILIENQHIESEETETVHITMDVPNDMSEESHAEYFDETQLMAQGEKLSSHATKVLLNPIPGRTAFSSLVEPFKQLSTEIAATSIQHNLTADGRGMNERTFDAISEQRKKHSEPQSPLFPKTNVPSPNEMFTEESRRTDHPSSVSPTPQYLRTQKVTSTEGLAKRQSDFRVNRSTISQKPEDSFSVEDIARLETVAAWE